MKTKIIRDLRNLIPHGSYTVPDIEDPNETDDLVNAERYNYDVDYFFREGFKIGLALGIEVNEK